MTALASVWDICAADKKTQLPPLVAADLWMGSTNKIIWYSSDSATRSQTDTVFISMIKCKNTQIQTNTKNFLDWGELLINLFDILILCCLLSDIWHVVLTAKRFVHQINSVYYTACVAGGKKTRSTAVTLINTTKKVLRVRMKNCLTTSINTAQEKVRTFLKNLKILKWKKNNNLYLYPNTYRPRDKECSSPISTKVWWTDGGNDLKKHSEHVSGSPLGKTPPLSWV